MNRSFIVGVTGGSASGKTEFVNKIISHFEKNDICLISQDNYYRPRTDQVVDESGYVNFDLPESIDATSLAKHIEQLKKNQIVSYSEYSFVNEMSNPKMAQLYPAPVVILEGIFVLHYPEVVRHLDMKIYIEADKDLMLKRRLARDQGERGYGLDEITHRFQNHVLPAQERYINAGKKMADIVINNNVNFDRAFEVVATFLQKKIANIKDSSSKTTIDQIT